MKLHIASIVPIELFTKKRSTLVEGALLENKKIYEVDNEVSNIFNEISGNGSKFYSVSPLFGGGVYLAFHESSACIYIEKTIDDWVLNRETVTRELAARNLYHKEIITNSKKSPANGLVTEILSIIPDSEYGVGKINYVFSFYVVEGVVTGEDESSNLKIFAEPSLIDLDDMLSTQCEDSLDPLNAYEIKTDYVESLSDIDISSNVKTYITWATIVSVVNESQVGRTKSLLAALECRLQIVWNRCYSVSEFIDSVFECTDKPSDVGELYWSFAKTLDDAKSVLSSTYSSRADRFFAEMIQTSKISGEIDRLEQKINLLEKYIEQNSLKLNKKYQKTIELLLFITALASLAQVFFPLPMSVLPASAEYVVMGVLAVVGVLAIYKSR
jgi:hypothetical protein